jgi:hypothetical protein
MLRWACVPAVAAVLIVTGILFQRRAELMRAAPVTMASKGTSPAATASPSSAIESFPESEPQSASEAKAALPAPKPLAKPAHAQADQAPTAESLTAAKVASNTPEESFRAGTVPPTASPTAQGSMDALLKAVPAVPMQNGFAENGAPAASNLVATSPSFVPNPQMAKQSVSATHLQWHITPDGHLEQRNASGNWTRVLAEQPITFHVVSVVGDNVWAGGSGGVQFHSSDGGQHWSQQPIGSPPDVETDTIVAIRFSDATHGVVTTEGRARWSTSDGGATWTKQ